MSPAQKNWGFFVEDLNSYLKGLPLKSDTTPPAATATACPAAISH